MYIFTGLLRGMRIVLPRTNPLHTLPSTLPLDYIGFAGSAGTNASLFIRTWEGNTWFVICVQRRGHIFSYSSTSSLHP